MGLWTVNVAYILPLRDICLRRQYIWRKCQGTRLLDLLHLFTKGRNCLIGALLC